MSACAPISDAASAALHLSALNCVTTTGGSTGGRGATRYEWQMPIQSGRLGIPEHFEIEESGGTLRIQWKWPRLMAVALVCFSVGWDVFLYSWYAGVLAQGAPSTEMLLFPIPHVIAGLVMPYLALAYLLNSTFVEVADGELRVRHRPVPFPGNRTLTARDVRQLFAVERRGRKGSISFAVMARLASDRETKLVSGLGSEREAQFIEQRIESRLGLTDQPTFGELPR
jgi:hypothetical protein